MSSVGLMFCLWPAAGPRKPGEGVENEEQGIMSAEEVASTGYVRYAHCLACDGNAVLLSMSCAWILWHVSLLMHGELYFQVLATPEV
jgi:hypothetical protein